MKTKVRVKRRELVKVVEGRLRKAEKDYKRSQDTYPDRVASWNAKQAARLDKLAAKARNGGLAASDTRVYFDTRPQQPSEGRELCNLRRMLKTLQIGAEETILLSQDDADWYFGECKL